jgi:hypothetical protein
MTLVEEWLILQVQKLTTHLILRHGAGPMIGKGNKVRTRHCRHQQVQETQAPPR